MNNFISSAIQTITKSNWHSDTNKTENSSCFSFLGKKVKGTKNTSTFLIPSLKKDLRHAHDILTDTIPFLENEIFSLLNEKNIILSKQEEKDIKNKIQNLIDANNLIKDRSIYSLSNNSAGPDEENSDLTPNSLSEKKPEELYYESLNKSTVKLTEAITYQEQEIYKFLKRKTTVLSYKERKEILKKFHDLVDIIILLADQSLFDLSSEMDMKVRNVKLNHLFKLAHNHKPDTGDNSSNTLSKAPSAPAKNKAGTERSNSWVWEPNIHNAATLQAHEYRPEGTAGA